MIESGGAMMDRRCGGTMIEFGGTMMDFMALDGLMNETVQMEKIFGLVN